MLARAALPLRSCWVTAPEYLGVGMGFMTKDKPSATVSGLQHRGL